MVFLSWIAVMFVMGAACDEVKTTPIDAVPAVRYKMFRDPLLLVAYRDGTLVGHSLTTGSVEWQGSVGGPLIRTEVERMSEDDMLGRPFVAVGDMLLTRGKSGELHPYQTLSWLMRHPYSIDNGTEIIVTTAVEKLMRSSVTGRPTILDDYAVVHIARLDVRLRVTKTGVFAWQMDVGKIVVSHQAATLERFKSRALQPLHSSQWHSLVVIRRNGGAMRECEGSTGEVCLAGTAGTTPLWCTQAVGDPAAAVLWTNEAAETIRLLEDEASTLQRVLPSVASPRNANTVDENELAEHESILRFAFSDERWSEISRGRTSATTSATQFAQLEVINPAKLRYAAHAVSLVAAAVLLMVGILPRSRLTREWASYDALQAELRLVASQPPSAAAAPKAAPVGTSPMTLDLQQVTAPLTLDEGWLPPRGLTCVGEGVFARQFEVLEKLGGGGGGSVLAVRHFLTRECYAVKVVLMDDFERVRREAVVHSGFHHPNVVRYHNCWTEAFTLQTLETFELFPEVDSVRSFTSIGGDKRFARDSDTEDSLSIDVTQTVEVLIIQMEYFKDGTLAAYLRTRDAAEAANYQKNMKLLLAVATGLEYVHSMEVVHQDIKPSNIFIVGETAKIGDFGLSTKVLDGVVGAGTPPYRSPEQAAGSAPQFSMDIYALGIVMAECLCHFTTSHERLVTLDELTTEGKIPLTIANDFPTIGCMILDMTHSNPQRRPTAAAVVAALSRMDAAMNDNPTQR